MPASEVDPRDYRPFLLCKLNFVRDIVRVPPVTGQFLIQHSSKNRQTAAREMISGVAR
jgi:hypothetical protein